MHNRLILLLFAVILLIPINVFGQNRTYSPYSRYGVGDINYSGFSQNIGLGNSGIALRSSEHINNFNPASFTSLDSLSFYLEAGIKGYNQNIKSTQASTNFSDINFDYFAMAFPLSHWGYSCIGLLPFSNTGYDVTSNISTDDIGDQTSYAIGTGNISKVYYGLGISPIKNLSLGVRFSLLFGNLTNINYIGDTQDPIALKYGKMTELHVGDFLFDYGVQYQLNINSEHSFIFGATFTPKTQIRSDRTVFLASGIQVEQAGDLYIDGDTLSFEVEKFSKDAFEFPMSYGFGLTYQIKNQLIWTADYKVDKWSQSNMSFFDASDAIKISSGIEYIPKDRSSKSYLNRIRYRIGSHYIKDYISNDNLDYSDFGINFGVGLPLKRSKSSVNINYEYGQRGTKNNSNLQETYSKISLNFTLHEYWFIKSKFE